LRLRTGLQAMTVALLPLTLVRLVALNLVRKAGGAAARRCGLRLGLRRARPLCAGSGARTAVLLRTLAGAAITMTVTMFVPGLCEGGRGGQGQDGNRYQQAAHGFLPNRTPNLTRR